MHKTVIRLPNGSLLSSGKTGEAAIQHFSLTKSVNESRELTLGSACAAMVEVTVLSAGDLSVNAGDTLRIYRENESGKSSMVGVFIAEKPTRISANTVKLTAYDRMILLDRDLTTWLKNLDGWPYTVKELAKMVCSACGVNFVWSTLRNEDYPVNAFTGEGITGRQIMRWIGEITGSYCCCTPSGNIALVWYTSRNIRLTPTGNRYYYAGGLSYEDYTVEPIEKLQLRQNDGDVGTIYPSDAQGDNAYIITGNPLLSANSAGSFLGVAQTLYEHLQAVRYTPCTLRVPADYGITVGDIIRVVTPKRTELTVYVMTLKQSGDSAVLECTGSIRRSSTTAVNDRKYRSLSGKMLELRTTVDGIFAQNQDTEGKMASLNMQVQSIASAVSVQQTDVSGIKTQLTSMEQTAQAVSLQVQTLQDSGVHQVRTETGFTFDSRGLTISEGDGRMENLLNQEGMYVKRSGDVILQADQTGVKAVDVRVQNYLIVGEHSRLEDYSSGADTARTACFWI